MATTTKRKPAFKLKPRYILLLFLLAFFILGGVYLSQQTTLASIASDKIELQAQLDARKVEQERLERMLEYMQTDEYLMQYAREKLGYVFSDDIKFYSEETAESSLTAKSTAEPKSTMEPKSTIVPKTTPVPATTDAPSNSAKPAVTAPISTADPSPDAGAAVTPEPTTSPEA